MTTTTRKTARAEHDARIAELLAAARAQVATGHCPQCGSTIHRNSALAGWYQCDRSGSGHYRLDPTGEACNWQSFTER